MFTDAYSEMSATALKQLTMTNTVRNQHYLSARLETEVIKKDGARPESPMVKIKTIAQRQLEEQTEQRTERAKRRARELFGMEAMARDLEGALRETVAMGPVPTPVVFWVAVTVFFAFFAYVVQLVLF